MNFTIKISEACNNVLILVPWKVIPLAYGRCDCNFEYDKNRVVGPLQQLTPYCVNLMYAKFTSGMAYKDLSESAEMLPMLQAFHIKALHSWILGLVLFHLLVTLDWCHSFACLFPQHRGVLC